MNSRFDFWLKAAYILGATVLFALPLLAAVHVGADPMTMANESVAYRFLYSERLLGGEGATVWVLAGFLTTAVQNVLLAIINAFMGVTAENLKMRVYAFAYTTNALHTLVAAAIFALAGASRRLLWVDRLLLALVGLGPLYLTRTTGFYYYTVPDYYLTNVVLTLAAVFLFQNEWRRPEAGDPLLRCALLGFFSGLMVANKITMLPLSAVMLAPALLAEPARASAVVARILAAAGSASAAFLFVIVAFYIFKIGAALAMFASWLRFTLNPGGETGFWTAKFWDYFVYNSYGWIIAFWLLGLAAAFVILLLRKPLNLRGLLVLTLNLLSGVVWGYFLYKRPAGTTFFEASVVLLALAACSLTVAAATLSGRMLGGVAIAAWAVFALTTFSVSGNMPLLRESGPLGQRLWRLHRDVMAFAGGRHVIVVHPRNGFGYAGVPEFLLKGSADTPTWNVSAGGEKIVHRYAPGMSFRHEYGGTPPDAPLPAGVVVYWVDLPWFKPLSEVYPTLHEVRENPVNESHQWKIEYPFAGKGVEITAHAVLLKAPAGAKR